ncbi:Vacuolar import and degradation protein 27 [Metarhizium anisopliae]
MFMLRNVGKLIFGSGTQEALIELPQGQLYLVRPLSPKGYSELIFKDSAIRIRRTNQDFHYQLVVQRVFEEGEAELIADEEGEDAEIDALAAERDEKTFLLDEALRFRVEIREGGETVFAWRDLSGDNGDLYEFVCDTQVPTAQVEQFVQVAKQCQYERKYRKPHTTASDEDYQQFEFHDENPIPPASPLHSPVLARSIESVDDMYAKKTAANTGAKREPLAAAAAASLSEPEPEAESEPELEPELEPETKGSGQSKAPEPDSAPEPLEIYASLPAELHLFDPQPGHFELIDDSVIATVSEVGQWQYWLQIESKERSWVGTSVVPEFNPVFDFEYLSFVFNHFSSDGTARSWLLRFKDQPTLEKFQEAIMQAIWERLNETKWAKVQEKEREYVLDAFGDLNMEDAPPLEEEEEEEEEEEHEEEEDAGIRSDDYESEEDEEADEEKPGGDINSQLAVGYKHDRSFVVRGSKIGVFSHTADNRLKFNTNISRVTTPGGKLMSPKKVMLHSEDRDLIIQNGVDANKLYRMDIEYGKVVDEWKVHDDIPVVTFAPENKFAQMTSEQTFLGVSSNALYRVDPRPYIVEWDLKKLLRGVKTPYKIKRYQDEVKADDFKFGSDKNVIVALPNEVNMVAKQSLRKPTRESIMGDLRLSGGRRSSGRISNSQSGRYKLGRDDIVNSPY